MPSQCMMPVNEPASDQDEPPAAVPMRAEATLCQEARLDTAPNAALNPQETEIDDFGLPVKRPNKRTADDVKGVGSDEQEVRMQCHNGNAREELSDGQGNLDEFHEAAENPDQAVDKPCGASSTEDAHQPLPATSTAIEDEPSHVGTVITSAAGIRPQSTIVVATGGVSEWSHQALAPHKVETEDPKQEEQWQDMPAFAPYDLYDDDGKLVAREARDSDDEANAYAGLGGAGKGYTRVQVDEDAQSATSMDDNTEYLFKRKGIDVVEEDEEQRDPLAQMQATKDLLTEGQRIAYVGVTRLAMAQMIKELDDMEGTRATRKELVITVESMKMWSQKMMVRLYAHMEIDSSGISATSESLSIN